MARHIPPCFITRPLPEGLKSVAWLMQQGVTAYATPLQKVILCPLLVSLIPYHGVLFTSPRAFLSLSANQRDLLKTKPLYGVGYKTVQNLSDQGFKVVLQTQTVAALIAQIEALKRHKPLLYLRGAVIRTNLKKKLHALDEAITYKLQNITSNIGIFKQYLIQKKEIIVLFQSVSAAERFLSLVPAENMNYVHALCQSLYIQKCLANQKFLSISCASEPTEVSLLKRTVHFFEKGLHP